ncbi:ExbD/TolR family protein [Calditrichota bacterium]
MAFAPSKGKKNPKEKEASLQMNSMMDMMTIILLFLLKSMSSSGALIQPSPYLELPQSQRETEPKKAVALLVTVEGVFEDKEGEPRMLSPRSEMEDEEAMVLTGLEGFLLDQKGLAERLGREFTGEVTIQCDMQTRYDWLLKVINTCGQAEFGTIDFVVKKKES